MKPIACAVAVAALVVAAPALALPNAFWTFGWKAPGHGVPWTIGDARGATHGTELAHVADPLGSASVPAPAKPVYASLLGYDLAGL